MQSNPGTAANAIVGGFGGNDENAIDLASKEMILGEYFLHIFLQETSQLTTKSDKGEIDAIIKVNAFGQSKYSGVKSKLAATSVGYWHEHIYFQKTFSSREELEEAMVEITVSDNSIIAQAANSEGFFSSNDIGNTSLSLVEVYSSPNHCVINNWGVLINSKDPSNSKGFVKYSVNFGLIQEPRKDLEVEAIRGGANQSMAFPPQIKVQFEQLDIRLFRGKKIVSKDLFSKSDPFLRFSLGSVVIESPYVDNSSEPEYNLNLFVSFTIPIIDYTLRIDLLDQDFVSSDIIGSNVVHLKDIFRGMYALPRWIYFYGAPENSTNKSEAAILDSFSELGTSYKGEILLSIAKSESKTAKSDSVPLDVNAVNSSQQIICDFLLNMNLIYIQNLLLKAQNVEIGIFWGSYYFPQKKCPLENGIINYNGKILVRAKFEMPLSLEIEKRIEFLPNIFLAVMVGKTMVSYHRFKCTEFLPTRENAREEMTVNMKIDRSVSEVRPSLGGQAVVQGILFSIPSNTALKPNNQEEWVRKEIDDANVSLPFPPVEYYPMKIIIYLFQATGLLASDNTGTSDPIVQFYHFGSVAYSSQKNATLTPSWNEQIILTSYMRKEKKIAPLLLSVWDADISSVSGATSYEFLGGVTLDLKESDIIRDMTEIQHVPTPQLQNLIYDGETKAGKILLCYQIVPQTFWDERISRSLTSLNNMNVYCEPHFIKITIMSLRDLKSHRFTPVRKAEISIERQSLRSVNENIITTDFKNLICKSKNVGPNPLFSTAITFWSKLPVDAYFIPSIACTVQDSASAVSSKDVIGTFYLHLGKFAVLSKIMMISKLQTLLRFRETIYKNGGIAKGESYYGKKFNVMYGNRNTLIPGSMTPAQQPAIRGQQINGALMPSLVFAEGQVQNPLIPQNPGSMSPVNPNFQVRDDQFYDFDRNLIAGQQIPLNPPDPALPPQTGINPSQKIPFNDLILSTLPQQAVNNNFLYNSQIDLNIDGEKLGDASQQKKVILDLQELITHLYAIVDTNKGILDPDDLKALELVESQSQSYFLRDKASPNSPTTVSPPNQRLNALNPLYAVPPQTTLPTVSPGQLSSATNVPNQRNLNPSFPPEKTSFCGKLCGSSGSRNNPNLRPPNQSEQQPLTGAPPTLPTQNAQVAIPAYEPRNQFSIKDSFLGKMFEKKKGNAGATTDTTEFDKIRKQFQVHRVYGPNDVVIIPETRFVEVRGKSRSIEIDIPDPGLYYAYGYNNMSNITKQYRRIVRTSLEKSEYTGDFVFQNENIYRGKRVNVSKSFLKRFFAGDSMHQKVGEFKGTIEIQREELLTKLQNLRLTPEEYEVFDIPSSVDQFKDSPKDQSIMGGVEVSMFLYVLDAFFTESEDIGSANDSYVKVSFGKKSLKSKVINDNNRPNYFEVFRFDDVLPSNSSVKIEFFDKDDFTKDDKIGEVNIDPERRFFDPVWQSYPNKPIEQRQIKKEKTSIYVGEVKLWLDIVKKSDVRFDRYRPVNIQPRPDTHMFVRIVVWEVRNVPRQKSEGTVDLYVTATLPSQNEVQQTDTHFKSPKGYGSFNWRFVFEMNINSYTKPSDLLIYLKIYDKDFLSANDFIASYDLDISPAVEELLDTNSRASLDGPNSKLPSEFTRAFIVNPQLQKSSDFSEQQNKDAPVQMVLTVDLVTAREAKNTPVGKGREAPNTDPFLPPPKGRFDFISNPLDPIINTLKEHWKVIGVGACAACFLLSVFLLFVPVFLSVLASMAITRTVV